MKREIHNTKKHQNKRVLKTWSISLLGILFLLNLPTQAQTYNCSYDDFPLYWDWIQEIIADSDGCTVAEIQYLFSSNYIQVIPGESGSVFCPSGAGNRIFDCQGNFICEYGGDTPFTTWCDEELINATDDRETIWRYGDETPNIHSIIPIQACPGERIEYYLGIESPGGTTCEPAGHHTDLIPPTYQPVVTDITQESACSISFTFQGEGNFIYSIQDPEDSSAIIDCVFQLSYKESCDPNSSCNVSNPLQIGWIQDLINSDDGCGVGAILQFEYAGDVYFRVDPGKVQNGTPCPSETPSKFYNCAGELVCEFGFLDRDDPARCDADLIDEARNTTIIWRNENSTFQEICPADDPLQWPWIRNLIENSAGCGIGEIYLVEGDRNTYITTYPGYPPGLLCQPDGPIFTYTCNGELVCIDGINSYSLPNRCSNQLLPPINSITKIWTYGDELPTLSCPVGDPLQWDFVQNIINQTSEYGGCGVNSIQQFQYNGNTYIKTTPGDISCPSDIPVILYNCEGTIVCKTRALAVTPINEHCDADINAAAYNGTTIWRYDEVDNPPQTNLTLFEDFSWLNSRVNPNNCNGESITVYDAGSYNFVLIQNGNEGKLYFENGTYYCDETPSYSCVTAYGLSNVAQSWTCGNNTQISGCTDANAINYDPNASIDDSSCQYETTNDLVFTTYPWLSTYINQSDCVGNGITVYDAGSYNFILIQNGNEGKLYFENGTYYCDETPSYSCIAAYGLSNVVQSWTCGFIPPNPQLGCTDVNAINYNPSATVDDGSCQYESIGTCDSYTGTFFYEDCGGISYYFIRLADGRVFDPYFAEGTGFTPLEGQQIRFDYEIKTDITTPCTISENPITIVCYQVIENTSSVFEDYPWLNTYINPANCRGETVTVYDAGSYNFLSLTSASGRDLYYQNGTYYCSDAPGFDCVAAYGLSIVANSWACGDTNSNPTSPRNCEVENPITDLDWLAYILYSRRIPTFTVIVSTHLYNNELIYSVDYSNSHDNITYYYCDGEEICWFNPFGNLGNCIDFNPIFVEEIYYYPTYTIPTLEFYKYSWLLFTISFTECIWEPQVLEFDFGNYAFVYFKTAWEGKLYLNDGTLYCEDTDGQTCLNSYNLVNPTETWVCSGVSEKRATRSSFTMYPNPTSNKVFIDLPVEAAHQIKLSNISGKVIKQLETNIGDSVIEINVDDLTKGMYLIEVKNELNRSIKKLIVE